MKATMLNGTLFVGEDCDDVSLSASDRGFLLGDGLFETLPVLHGAPLWWQEHSARLTQSANRLGMSLDHVMLEHTVSQLAALSGDDQHHFADRGFSRQRWTRTSTPGQGSAQRCWQHSPPCLMALPFKT